MQLRNGKITTQSLPVRRPTHVYIGAGADTYPFRAEWCNGTTIHCVDGQPHSEFGNREYYPSGGATEWQYKGARRTEIPNDGVPDGTTPNGFARPSFAIDVLSNYHELDFMCSMEDYKLIMDTRLLGPTYTRLGEGPTRVRFINEERDIIIWYHFNASLPDHATETLNFIGTYDGIICKGHHPHKTLINNANPDKSLTFRGYAPTCFGIYAGYNITENDISNSMVIRLSFDRNIRRKFKNFVFYDTYGVEHWFNMWEEFLVFYHYNPSLTDDPEEEEEEVEDWSDEERRMIKERLHELFPPVTVHAP
jgi:hypothetical protein